MKNLIEKEGRYFEECGLVMLPTEEKALIYLHKRLKTYYLYNEFYHKDYNYQGYHLHITSDDKIKKGDNILNISTKKIEKAFGSDNGKNWKKIITTTDKSLEIYTTKGKGVLVDNLPQPSQSFIKAFVKAGGIDKVLVEYVKELDSILLNRTNSYKPKTDSHNTITIKEVKEKMYSRKEVEIIAKNAFMAGGTSGYNSVKGLDFQTSSNWIKENL